MRAVVRGGVLFVVLAVLIPLGGCGDDGGEPVPAGVLSSIDGFNEAGSRYDTEAMRTYLTDDFTWQSTGPVQTQAGFLAHVDRYWETTQFRYEVTGEPLIRLDGETYVVEEPGRVTAVNLDTAGMTVYRVVDVDGQWLIQEAQWIDAPAD